MLRGTDGERALTLLGGHPHITVLYGHIHQEHRFVTGNALQSSLAHYDL